MAETTLNADLQVKKWLSRYFSEYVRSSGFRPYMGRGSNSVIHVVDDLKSGGKVINVPLVTRLKADGVTGTTVLVGNEEELGNFNHEIRVGLIRHAIVMLQQDEHYSAFSMLQAGRDQLTNWHRDKLRRDVITALGSINGVAYSAATAAQRNAWTAANEDRVLFGNARVNFNATHATGLGAITTAMTLSAGVVSLLKRMAKTADPHIRPMRLNDASGREYFVLFAGSMAFRDLKLDTTIAQANREARPRDVERNPIFQDGDLIFDGVIIREIPEIESLGTVGNSSARVSPVYLCGAQALGVAYGKEPYVISDNLDYGERRGIGTAEIRGIEKLRFATGAAGASIDHGMVTGYVAAANDA